MAKPYLAPKQQGRKSSERFWLFRNSRGSQRVQCSQPESFISATLNMDATTEDPVEPRFLIL